MSDENTSKRSGRPKANFTDKLDEHLMSADKEEIQDIIVHAQKHLRLRLKGYPPVQPIKTEPTK